MTVLEAVRARLLAQSALTALVSSRIYAQNFPQSALFPAVRLQRIGEGEPTHLRGASGIARARIQVDSVAEATSGADARANAVAVDAAAHGDGAGSGLNAFAGTVGGMVVESILPIDVREGYDPDELRQFVVSRDYYVSFRPV